MSSLFRRKSAELAEKAEPEPSGTDPVPPAAGGAEDVPEPVRRSKSHTPSKKELGLATPKRASNQRRRVADEAPANRREAYRKTRERQRAERAEASAGMRRGDERYLLPRDKGPERALTRDIVDSRRTVGTFFFAGALVVLIGSSAAMPPVVRLVSNALWATLAVALVIDSVLICLKVRRLVRERHPKTTQRMGGLCFYAVMRSITFRRMRIPNPRVEIGDAI